MIAMVILVVLVVLAVALLLVAGSGPRERDRGGFEDHPGPNRMGPWG